MEDGYLTPVNKDNKADIDRDGPGTMTVDEQVLRLSASLAPVTGAPEDKAARWAVEEIDRLRAGEDRPAADQEALPTSADVREILRVP